MNSSDQRREDVDGALSRWACAAHNEFDGDVAAAIARRGDAPENEDAEQQSAEVVTIRDRRVEDVAQQDGDEDVERDEADERCRRELDAVDEPVHRMA